MPRPRQHLLRKAQARTASNVFDLRGECGLLIVRRILDELVRGVLADVPHRGPAGVLCTWTRARADQVRAARNADDQRTAS
ncbi:hypothetical protein ACWDA7_38040 [Streptomyces sp. NPDC001156]